MPKKIQLTQSYTAPTGFGVALWHFEQCLRAVAECKVLASDALVLSKYADKLANKVRSK